MRTNSTAKKRAATEVDARDEVLAGLRAPRKHLPCKLLYDARGAALFEQITTLEDYYLTRAEHALLTESLPAIAAAVGPGARVVEPGSGAGVKTRMLLAALDAPSSYVPIDVSAEQLAENAAALATEFPAIAIQPVCGDYTVPLALPPPAPARRPGRPDDHSEAPPAASQAAPSAGRTLVFFPGSTIGNFEPDAAHAFLRRLAQEAGPGAMLLLGADANQDAESLLRAYDDREGVTAEFDRNVLAHLNRSHGTDFDVDAFLHRAIWDAGRSRIEMHLVSRRRQTVTVAGESFHFERGEPIVTEHCYKHPPALLHAMLGGAGWRVGHVFVDPHGRMRLWLAST